MYRFLRYAIFLVFVLTNVNCSHPASPIDLPRKDPRTYTWAMDTIYYTKYTPTSGQTSIYDIWIANDTIAYAVGFDTFSGPGVLWKYDGKTWSRVKLMTNEGGFLSQGTSLFSIEGTDANNIYAFGEKFTNITGEYVRNALILHFDGIQWKEVEIPQGTRITSAVALSSSLIYAGGDYGQFYQFDGMHWTHDSLYNKVVPNFPSSIYVIGASGDGGVYLLSVQDLKNGVDYLQLYKYKNKRLIVIDSTYDRTKWGALSFWTSDRGTIYSSGDGGIFRLSDNIWKKYYASEYIGQIGGLNENHLFAVSVENILFYDGMSWTPITRSPNLAIYSSFAIRCSEDEVFIIFNDGRKSYILHGK